MVDQHFKIVQDCQLVLVLPHSNAGEEGVFLIVFQKARFPYQRCVWPVFLLPTAKFSSNYVITPPLLGCGFITYDYKKPTIPCNLGLFLSSQ